MRASSRLAVGVVVAVVLGVSLFHFVASCYSSIAHGVVDFPIFLSHVRSFHETGRLYVFADHLPAYAPGTPVYKFPPLYAMLLLPVVRGGIPHNVNYWHWGVQIALYLLAVSLIVLTLHDRAAPVFPLLAAVLALNYEPFFETLWRLQIETLLLVLLAVCLWGLKRERSTLVGALMGLAVMLKIYPALLLVWLLVRRWWRALAACAAAMIVIQLLSLLVIGARENYVYFFRILPSMLGETSIANVENLGFGRYLQEFLGLGAVAAKRVSQLLVAGLLGLSLWAVHRGRHGASGRNRVALELALFTSLLVLVLPNSWVNYQLLLLVPYLVLTRQALSCGRSGRVLLGALMVGWVFLLFYAPCADPSVEWPCARTPWFLGLVQLPRGFHDLMVSLRILGTIAPFGVALAMLLGPRDRSAAA